MTTLPARLPPLPPPPSRPIVPPRLSVCPRATQPHRLYFVYAFDPRTAFTTLVLAYVGITSRRTPTVRFEEHVEDQPWSDTIPIHDPQLALAARIFILADDVYCCETHARETERDAIVANRPLYNYEHNLTNPDRITIFDARNARAVRDHARNLPYAQTWAAKFAAREAAREAARQLAEAAATAPVPVSGERWWAALDRRVLALFRSLARRRWSRQEKAVLGYSALWLAASMVGWYVLARWLPIAATWRLGGVAGAVAGMVVLWRTEPPKRRRRKRALRAAHRAGVIVLLGVVAWLLLAGR